MGFALLDQWEELVISAPIGCVAESIGGSIVHTALGVNTRQNKSFVTKTSIKGS